MQEQEQYAQTKNINCKMMNELGKYAEQYKNELLQSVIPF